MKLLITALYFIALSILSCSPANKTESPTDLTVADSVSTAVIESPESITTETPDTGEKQPFKGSTQNFPLFSMEMLSGDSLESQLNTNIGNMLEAYDTLQYSRIVASYSWERPYYAPGQDGPGSMATETEEETRVWYFDPNNKLRGFSTEYKGDSGYPVTKLILYLFSNDSLTAVYQRTVDDSEVTVVQEMKMLKPLGPRCGISITYGASETPGIHYLTQEDMESKRLESAQSLDELITFLKSNRNKAKADGYDLIFKLKRTKEGNTEDKSKTIIYEVEIRMAKTLYDNYVSNK